MWKVTGSCQLSFGPIISYAINDYPAGLAIGDFNNDHKEDLMIISSVNNTMTLLLGYGNGSFANQVIYATGFDSRPYGLAVGDINNDNSTDVVITNDGYGNINILSKIC